MDGILQTQCEFINNYFLSKLKLFFTQNKIFRKVSIIKFHSKIYGKEDNNYFVIKIIWTYL